MLADRSSSISWRWYGTLTSVPGLHPMTLSHPCPPLRVAKEQACYSSVALRYHAWLIVNSPSFIFRYFLGGSRWSHPVAPVCVLALRHIYLMPFTANEVLKLHAEAGRSADGLRESGHLYSLHLDGSATWFLLLPWMVVTELWRSIIT